MVIDDTNKRVTNLLLEKFAQEEIMTKSEFETRIDAIMEKHEVRIEAKFDSFEARMNTKFTSVDAKFDSMEARFDRQFLKIDNRYNWIIGLTVTSVIGICGLLFKIMTMVAVH